MNKVTIMDIAKAAGVSKSTVSRVLSRPDMVNSKTRNRVLELMKQMDYIPNQLAQGLAGTPTRNIGVVIDELSNFFFIEIAEGVDWVLNTQNYSMQLSSSRWVEEREFLLVRSLISSRVDGILLAPVLPESPTIRLLKHAGIPFVLMNCIPEDEEISYVSCDNVKGGELAAHYINSLEKEQTILITGFEHQSMGDRVDGFYNCVDHSKGDIKRYRGVKTFEDGYDLVPILLSRDEIERKRSVLFITNDNVALGVMEHLVALSIPIPEQVSVVGYDNIRLSSLCRIPLTTVSQSIRDMGRIAAMELLDLMASPDSKPKRHLLAPEFVVRSSSV
ncbi:LacI family DNA-binding transcriptional regulator [Sediminispirochaeta bajacaliforniensis]|uniref:LacI family DNA-binding transcriptional regulator n=1 Tax=Sediminispirochaeta bajacaliforniensis TaxID=148 RepID=UPI000361E0FF|nr:LacI family DNA-binding transcriptional regulator [Sediminispirochaeta bajacaliforniensis]